METICPNCGKSNDYNSKKTTKNPRKTCKYCGHKYKVTPKTHPTYVKQEKEEFNEIFKPNETDIVILTHLKINRNTGMYQQQIVDATGFSRPTVFRRLMELKSKGIIEQDPIAYPKIWRIRKQPFTDTHNHQFVCKIVSGTPKIQAHRTQKMHNWEKKFFEIWMPRERIWVQNAELTTQSIVFWVESRDRNYKLAEEKAKDKAFYVKKHLESKYSIRLGQPIYKKTHGKQKAHAVPMLGDGIADRYIDPKDPTLSSEVWVDDTPEKNTIETGLGGGQHKTWIDNVNNELPRISQNITKINGDIAELVSQFGDFREIISKLVGNMNQLADNQSKVNEKIEVGFKALSQSIGEGIADLLRKTNKTEPKEQPQPKDGEESDEQSDFNIYL